jgi:TRAP-type transport system periplasmic protein
MFKLKFLTKQLITTCALMSVLSVSAQAAEITLKLHHFLPKQSPAHKNFVIPWKKAIEKESHGRIKVKIYPAMQLGGKAPNLVDQVKDGFVDVVFTLPAYTPGRFPAISAFELPFMVTDAVQTSQAIQEYYDTNKEVQKEFNDIHPLILWSHDRGVIHTKNKTVRSLADLKGMKIRIPSRPVADAMTAYGAVPVAMPIPQMPAALSKNVIDGTVVPWEIVPAFRLHELADSSTEVLGERGIYTAVLMLAMNKDKYNSLPADLKKVIDDNSGMKWAKIAGTYYRDAEGPIREMARQHGNTIVAMPAEDVYKMREEAFPVHTAWIEEMNKKGFHGQALLDSANALLIKYSKQ